MSKRSEREERRRRRTVKLEIPEETKAELYALAAEYRVPISQIAAAILEYGYDAIRNGEIDLTEYFSDSGAPQFYDHNIDIEELKRALRNKRKR